MQEVIHRVMEAEGEAKRILQEAQTEAERLIREAHQRVKESEEQVRTEVRQIADRLIEETMRAAEKEKAAQLARAREDIQGSIRLDNPLRCDVVNAVVACVADTGP